MPTVAKTAPLATKSLAQSWKQYAAGTYDLIADAPIPGLPASEIRMLAAGDLTNCYMSDGTTNRPLTGLPAGYVHPAPVSSVTCTVAIVVYW